MLYQGEPPSTELELEWQRSNEVEQRRKTERKIREEVRYTLLDFLNIFFYRFFITERT